MNTLPIRDAVRWLADTNDGLFHTGLSATDRLFSPAGEVGADGQGEWILGAEDPLEHWQQRRELVPGRDCLSLTDADGRPRVECDCLRTSYRGERYLAASFRLSVPHFPL